MTSGGGWCFTAPVLASRYPNIKQADDDRCFIFYFCHMVTRLHETLRQHELCLSHPQERSDTSLVADVEAGDVCKFLQPKSAGEMQILPGLLLIPHSCSRFRA